MKSLIAILVLFTAGPAAAQTTQRVSGTVRDTSGARIANLTLHFYQKKGKKDFTHLTTVTAANGMWFIDLPPGVWRGAAHSDDILRRGYFCFPGFVWGGGECPPVDPAWPALWGGGEVEWTPICGNPGPIVLTIVPTRPELSTEKPGTTQAGVKVSFETTTQAMTTVRQWRIEKSTDLLTWEPLQTVALSGTSPVIVPDPAGATTPSCFYRAVQVEDIVPSGP
jgi:hypothetical protein